MVSARALHDTVLLLNGDALAVGGIDDADQVLDTIEYYSQTSRRWSRGELGSAMGSVRSAFTATRLFNGNVLAAGGGTDRASAVATAEIFAA